MSVPSVFCPRCATSNPVDVTVCQNPACRRPLPNLAATQVAGAGPGQLGTSLAAGTVQAQLRIERAKSKSPELAAFIGLFAPWLGAFYNGKTMWGAAFLVLDLIAFVMDLGLPAIPVIGFRVFGAVINYRWAKEANMKALERLAAQ